MRQVVLLACKLSQKIFPTTHDKQPIIQIYCFCSLEILKIQPEFFSYTSGLYGPTCCDVSLSKYMIIARNEFP